MRELTLDEVEMVSGAGELGDVGVALMGAGSATMAVGGLMMSTALFAAPGAVVLIDGALITGVGAGMSLMDSFGGGGGMCTPSSPGGGSPGWSASN